MEVLTIEGGNWSRLVEGDVMIKCPECNSWGTFHIPYLGAGDLYRFRCMRGCGFEGLIRLEGWDG